MNGPTCSLHEPDVVGGGSAIGLGGLSMGFFQPCPPKALRGLHPVKAVAGHRFPKGVVFSFSQRIGHRHGQGRGSVGTRCVDHTLHLLGLHKRANGIMYEYNLHGGWHRAKGISDRGLSRVAATHHRRQLAKPLGLQAVADLAHVVLRNGNDEMAHRRMPLEDEQYLNEEGPVAQCSKLLAHAPQPTALSRSRNQYRHFIRLASIACVSHRRKKD